MATLPSKILIDSNVYFRLAQQFEPLLGQKQGKSGKVQLLLIEGFAGEYFSSPRLQSKFVWVKQDEYVENRKTNTLKISPSKKRAFDEAYRHLSETAKDEKLTTGPTDLRVLAAAYVEKLPVATDDEDMEKLAKEFEIEIFGTVDLLKLLLDLGVVTMDKVRAAAGYWTWLGEKPRNFRVKYKELFNEDPPA